MKSDGNLPTPAPVVSAESSANSSNPARQLKLIHTGLTADRKHVHVHFITGENQVTTIQLDLAIAATFHARLGELLWNSIPRPPAGERLN